MEQVPVWIVLAVLLLFIPPVRVKSGKGKTDYSYSKEGQFDSPNAFWPISSTLHGSGAPTSEATAILHGATIVPSGGVPTSSLGAVEFLGGASMNIINPGYLDGKISFSWYFYIYPYASQTATILEYEGSGGGKGVTLLQEGESLTARVYKIDGSLFGTYTRFDVSLIINEWNFVGFAYNKAWGHIDIMFGFNQAYFDLGQTDVLVNAAGNVVIGNAVDGSRPFRGKMCCIQFLEKAIFKDSPLQKLETFCELSQWDTNILSWTKTFVPTTTTSTTTSPTTTTTPTTTPSTTVTTTTHIPTTSPTTTTTTAATTTTTIATSTTASTPTTTTTAPTTLPSTSLTQPITTVGTTATTTQPPPSSPGLDLTNREHSLPMTDACYYFELQAENEDFAPDSSDLAVDSNKTIGSCAEMCTSYPQCVAFVLFENGRCRLGTSSSRSIPITSSATKMYVKTMEDREKYNY